MHRNRRWGAIAAAVLVATLLVTVAIPRVAGYFAQQQDGPLPDIVWLGRGPGTFTKDPGLIFLVKSPGNIYREVFEDTYEAAANERVWTTNRDVAGDGIPVFDDFEILGEIPAGCQVDYVQIDDDIDERRNGFLINDELVELVEQGEVTYGSFVAPEAGELIFGAQDSVGLIYRLCVEQPEPTPTATNTPTPQPPSPTPTQEPGEPTVTPFPTVLPSITPSPQPTEEPTPTPEPTKKPREKSCLRVNFDVSGDEARRGLYVVQEVGGMVLAEWFAEEGWTDSGWITGIDIPYESIYVDVLFYSGPGATPLVMKIMNPAPNSTHGWLSRGMCHALEVGWPN